MFNEMDRLDESPALAELLGHYAALAAADRQAWQGRLMAAEGRSPRELTLLHGELIAYGWLEQNTAQAEAPRPGEVPACYRVTPAGLRALRRPAGA